MTFNEWTIACYNEGNKINSALLASKNATEHRKKLKLTTHFLRGGFSFSERLIVYIENLNQPTCMYCNEPVDTMRDKRFNRFCSVKCSNGYSHQKKIARPEETITLQQYINKAYNKKTNKFSASYCTEKKLRSFGLYDELANLSQELNTPSISLKLRYIMEGHTSLPLCPICQSPRAFNGCIGAREYNLFCKTCGDPSCVGKISISKRKACMLEKYGVEYHSQLNTSREQSSKRMLGVKKSPDHCASIKIVQQERVWSKEAMLIMNDKTLFEELFEEGKSPVTIAKEIGVSHGSILSYAKKYNIHHKVINQVGNGGTSEFESEFSSFIESLHIPQKIYYNSRKLLNPLELDVFIPEKDIAIELNGIYWHSEKQGKNKNYHLNKTSECEDGRVRLYQVWDKEWNDPVKRDIWKSVLKNALGITETRIFARKCKIIELPFAFSKDFLNQSHLQGEDKSKVRYGLMYENRVVSIMTFCVSRFNRNYQWELSRFCNELDTIVIGGASKLLSHFRKNHTGSIVSYANRRWSDGGLYRALGFDELRTSAPNYFYWKNDTKRLYSRNKFQKHKLERQLAVFDPNLSEWENMKANGYDRIWDCGNYVFGLI